MMIIICNYDINIIYSDGYIYQENKG